MTLKLFVSKDSGGREWAPDTPHEVETCEWLLKKAWMEFSHLHELYAILVNLRHPTADMVVIRERGLGVVELKHVFGEIWIDFAGPWKAGSSEIHAGSNHLNPREQVLSYTKELRANVINLILPDYMQTGRHNPNDLKFQTAVCFTHPDVSLQKAQRYVNGRHSDFEPWENFSIFDTDVFTPWIRDLRFRLQTDATRNYAPVRLHPGKIVYIATQVLGCVEWEEMQQAMPSGNPYGYLFLEDADGRQVFNLVKDRSVIGRSHECDVVLPERYSRVSKKHCVIERGLEGIQIIDLESSNGTFLNGRPIKVLNPIMHGDTVILGGPSASEKVCALRFETSESAFHQTGETEVWLPS
jgi:hypothetical protein